METLLDELFAHFGDRFAGRPSAHCETHDAGRLPRARLDYSLSSLEEVDRYVERLQIQGFGPDDRAYRDTVWWAGAYVGEVIRRNATGCWHWVERGDFACERPDLAELLPAGFASRALLSSDEGSVTMPIQRVASSLERGTVPSLLQFYASLECVRPQTSSLDADADEDGAV